MTRMELPSAVRDLLSRVKMRIRRDSLAYGCLLAITLAIVVFWSTTALDAGWFLLQRLELPVGLRAIMLAILLPSAGWLLVRRVVYPIIRRVRDVDVALLLERRFPQFRDRLVLAVESSKGIPCDGPLAAPMLQRSVGEAAELAGKVQVSEVFETRAIKRMAIITIALFVATLIPALLDPGMVQRWWNAFVRCEEIYHDRTTDIHVVAIAQPGDRRVDFSVVSDVMTYRHPRGADLELEFHVPEGGPESGVEWIVPERIRVDLIRADGTRSRTYVSPSSSRGFRYVVSQLREAVELEVLAGDYRTRVPWRVEVVDTPGLDTIELNCEYPEYTGWNQQRERSLKVTGSEIPLPVGTRFELKANSAKTLQAARIVTEQFEVSGDRESSKIVLRDGRTIESSGQPLISEDGASVIASVELFGVPKPAAEPSRDGGKSAEPSGETVEYWKDGRLRIPSNTSLRFFLHDEDNVMSVSPETLRVQGVEDAAPVVVVQLTGIGNSVTRRARIPIAGRVRDDYGLQSAGFEFLVDDETSWRPRPFRSAPASSATEFELARSADEPFEYFELQPLELSEGQSLTLSVVATDGNPSPGPGQTRSTPFPFQIVSDEELLSVLYTREIGLRTRFEEVIAQLEEIQKDLQFHETVASRVDGAGAGAKDEDRISLLTCATRSGNSLRRQTNELSSIVEGFEEIKRQLVNNAIPLNNAETMQTSIIDPLRRVSGEMMGQADRALGAFRVAAIEKQASQSLVSQSSAQVSEVILVLKTILESVRDMAEFHEALRDLKQLSDEQRKIFEETKKLQKNQLFQDLLK